MDLTSFSGNIASLIPTLSCIFSLGGQERTRDYEGYQVLRIGNISSFSGGFSVLNQLYQNTGLFDMFTTPRKNGPTDVMVCQEQAQSVKFILNQFSIPYDVVVPNVKTAIGKFSSTNSLAMAANPGMNWNAYQRLSTIQSWMDSMASQYPQYVSVENFGTSFENRKMKVLKISASTFGNNPAIWVDGGIHAREWVASSTASYIANQLIQLANSQPDNPLFSQVDWYIVPNVNPDGYEYTWTGERMWRKTRSKNSASRCRGCDPNRNFNYKWGASGTSNNPCEEIYRGPRAASEKEVQAMQNYIYSKKDHIKALISFHSYSQMLFYPWAYNSKATLADKDDLVPIAEEAARALEAVHGTQYQVGAPGEILYDAAGGTYDWAKGVAGIKFAYTYELRDTGDYGFLLPPDQIIPTGEETFESVQSIVRGVMSYYGHDGW